MRLSKKLAKKILDNVEEDREFYAQNGNVFCNLWDLEEGLAEMSDEDFLYHAKEGRNDFSNWIQECIGDIRLADSLVGLDRKDSLKKIRARITYIEKYLEGV